MEIKSTEEIREEHTKTICQIASSWNRPCEIQVWSRDPQVQQIKQIKCLPWQMALKRLFNVKGS